MNKKDKVNCAKAGAAAYCVSSAIQWLREGGLHLINQEEAYVLKFYKSWGLVDVMRLEGKLKDLDVFGGDGFLFAVGMFSGLAAAGVMLLIEKYKAWLADDKPKKPDAYVNGQKISKAAKAAKYVMKGPKTAK